MAVSVAQHCDGHGNGGPSGVPAGPRVPVTQAAIEWRRVGPCKGRAAFQELGGQGPPGALGLGRAGRRDGRGPRQWPTAAGGLPRPPRRTLTSVLPSAAGPGALNTTV